MSPRACFNNVSFKLLFLIIPCLTIKKNLNDKLNCNACSLYCQLVSDILSIYTIQTSLVILDNAIPHHEEGA